MIEHEMGVPVAILAILRRDESVRGVADRLGVTEAQVEKWKDIFVVAGTLALSKTRSARMPLAAQSDGDGFGSPTLGPCAGMPTLGSTDPPDTSTPSPGTTPPPC